MTLKVDPVRTDGYHTFVNEAKGALEDIALDDHLPLIKVASQDIDNRICKKCQECLWPSNSNRKYAVWGGISLALSMVFGALMLIDEEKDLSVQAAAFKFSALCFLITSAVLFALYSKKH